MHHSVFQKKNKKKKKKKPYNLNIYKVSNFGITSEALRLAKSVSLKYNPLGHYVVYNIKIKIHQH